MAPSRVSSARPASRGKAVTSQLDFHVKRMNTQLYISSSTQQAERETTALFERWLQVPGIHATEVDVASSSSPSEAFWTDSSFPADDTAVFSSTEEEERQRLGALVWRRVTGDLFQLPVKPPVLLQGGLDDAWFLGALAAVACKPDLLLDLVVSDELAAKGLYALQLYKHGCWHKVLVDNLLPCLEQESRLAFCSSASSQELWPSLMEKAYAKLHGSYAALAGGSIADTLVDLTGGVVSKVNLDALQKWSDADSGALWQRITGWLAKGCIIACQAKHKGAAPTAQGLGGLLLNRAYSITDAMTLNHGTQLLKLHCPWEGGGWQGAWAPGSPVWQGEEGAAARQVSNGDGQGEPGACWMSFWDFMQVFNRLYIVQLFPKDWHQLTVHCGWVGPSAGGPHFLPQQQQQQQPHHQYQQQQSQHQRHQKQQLLHAASRARPGQLQSQQSQRQQQQRLERQQSQRQGQLRPKSALHMQRTHSALQPKAQQHWVHSSSTWCCNPQFCLTLQNRGTVVLCLGQQDLQMSGQCHTPKGQRPFQIGLLVLGPPKGGLGAQKGGPGRGRGRRWQVVEGDIVADTGLSGGREVMVQLNLEAGVPYVLVAYARQAGDQGPFVLRGFASASMEMEQLQSPLSLVIGGQWAGQLAGGSRSHPTWGSNPQYLLSCQRATTAVISLTRPNTAAATTADAADTAATGTATAAELTSTAGSLIAAVTEAPGAATLPSEGASTAVQAAQEHLPSFNPDACIGLTIAKPEESSEGLGRRATLLHETDVLAESGYGSCEEAVVVIALQPGTTYLLVPSTATPGIGLPYELRILSGAPVELMPLPELKVVALCGAWGEGSSGGCNLHATWVDNPRFLLQLPTRCSCSIRLSRLKGPWRKNAPLKEMIGFYILKAHGPAGQLPPEAMARAVLHESAFVPLEEACGQVELPGGVPLLVVPATYAPGVKGRFCLAVSARQELVLQALQ